MSVDWFALSRCPRCFCAWRCWTTQREHASRPMTRPHYERVRISR